MKQIPMLLLLGLALSLCNLLNKSRNSGSSGSGGSGTSSSNSGTVEKAHPNAAQTAALAGGQTAKWDQQGMSWTVPAKWTQTSNEEKSFMWRSPGGSEAANLIVNISSMDANFPTDVSIKAYYDAAKSREQNGEV